MTIHDNFDGSNHCVECKGRCKLTGDDARVTTIVRYLLEWAARLNNGAWMPHILECEMNDFIGRERLKHLKRRAMAVVEADAAVEEPKQ